MSAHLWTFGDGATSTAPSPSHSYAAAGRYIATHQFTDDDGSVSSSSSIVDVLDPIGWDFGDGTKSTETNPEHTYAAPRPAPYPVVFSAGYGASASDFVFVWMNPQFPIIIDSGMMYLNYGLPGEMLLGATRGGTGFRVSTEYHAVLPDGEKGPLEGTYRIKRIDAELNVKLIQMSRDAFLMALPGARMNGENIRRALAIVLDDYADNLTVLAEIRGKEYPAIITIQNALHDGILSIDAADASETVIDLTFRAHFDPADMDAEPWSVRLPTA